MLLISGLDVTIVGTCQLRQVSAYAIASMFTTFVPDSAVRSLVLYLLLWPYFKKRSEYPKIRRLLMRTSELNSSANLAFLMLVFFAGKPLLHLWVGDDYASAALPILKILAIGQAIRLAGNPYGTVLVATGLQKYAVPFVLAEGLGNLLLSISFVHRLGAIGVAFGTMAAATLALALAVFKLSCPSRVNAGSQYGFSRSGFIEAATYLLAADSLVCRPRLAHAYSSVDWTGSLGWVCHCHNVDSLFV